MSRWFTGHGYPHWSLAFYDVPSGQRIGDVRFTQFLCPGCPDPGDYVESVSGTLIDTLQWTTTGSHARLLLTGASPPSALTFGL